MFPSLIQNEKNSPYQQNQKVIYLNSFLIIISLLETAFTQLKNDESYWCCSGSRLGRAGHTVFNWSLCGSFFSMLFETLKSINNQSVG